METLVGRQRLRTLEADIARRRTELLADLNDILLKPLQALLTPAQKEKGPVPAAEE